MSNYMTVKQRLYELVGSLSEEEVLFNVPLAEQFEELSGLLVALTTE